MPEKCNKVVIKVVIIAFEIFALRTSNLSLNILDHDKYYVILYVILLPKELI